MERKNIAIYLSILITATFVIIIARLAGTGNFYITLSKLFYKNTVQKTFLLPMLSKYYEQVFVSRKRYELELKK